MNCPLASAQDIPGHLATERAMPMPVRISELLLREKRITPAQLQEALRPSEDSRGKIGFNLVKLGYVKDEEITGLLSKQYGVPSINLAQFDIDPSVIKLVPADTAQKYQIVPLSRAGATLTIAMTDPTNVFAMDDIKFMTGYNVEPVVASETGVVEAIQKYYGGGQAAGESGQSALEVASKALEDLPQVDDSDVEILEELDEIDVGTLERQGGEAPVIRLVNVVLMSAIQKGASDVHIEPYEREFRVRFRIDGILYNVMVPPMKYRDAITSRDQDHGEAGHCREAAASGRAHQDSLQRQRQCQGDRFPCLLPADALW